MTVHLKGVYEVTKAAWGHFLENGYVTTSFVCMHLYAVLICGSSLVAFEFEFWKPHVWLRKRILWLRMGIKCGFVWESSVASYGNQVWLRVGIKCGFVWK